MPGALAGRHRLSPQTETRLRCKKNVPPVNSDRTLVKTHGFDGRETIKPPFEKRPSRRLAPRGRVNRRCSNSRLLNGNTRNADTSATTRAPPILRQAQITKKKLDRCVRIGVSLTIYNKASYRRKHALADLKTPYWCVTFFTGAM